ncbi:hypothetical protein LGM63_20640 [Burkholderia cepacia]|uniref:GTP pyrophosphokinase n=1 Tax=Burkholderia cepacia TaxID=292 RepID=UPI001CF4111A|nr:hypothetical protein [Burkholderia cepacia]MCA7993057.1 hypothetical protein [Burkholderia cepacia]
MAENPAVGIMTAYDESRGARTDFCSSVERLLRDFLDGDGIRYVDVVSRVKERASLEEKIVRKGEGRYKDISDITDICGVRVITYFEGDVRRVCDILEREFEVDGENSVDKSRPADPDRFGYRSVHFVVSHSKDRRALREYRRFGSFKVEIQIRSILQHAWAEIEHDMGYKSADEVPALVKRRFSRLAGLLELADEEFMTIRKEIDEYERILPERLEESSDDVALDAESYVLFVNTDEVVTRIDQRIAQDANAILSETNTRIIDRRVSQMRFFGYRFVGEIKKALVANEALVSEVADRWQGRQAMAAMRSRGPAKRVSRRMQRGTSTLYLAYVLLLQNGDRAQLTEYMRRFIPEAPEIADELLETFPDFPR